jgi:D-alanine-D-alanine ligase
MIKTWRFLMNKLTIAVLFGGNSSEHEVSCLTAKSVIDNLNKEIYNILPIGISKHGHWLLFKGDTEKIETGQWINDKDNLRVSISPNLALGNLITIDSSNNVGFINLDVVFPALHGKNGEDGTIQGLLELSGIPFVGSGCLSSAVCMDKSVANSLVGYAGIDQPDWLMLTSNDLSDKTLLYDNLERRIGYPMFVKPACAGSSIGISKVKDRNSLFDALILAFSHDSKVVVEREIVGKELECAVFGETRSPFASVVSEIFPQNEFYDYESKYDLPSITEVPANISDELSYRVQENAKKIFSMLGCHGMARIDFLYEVSTDTLHFKEVNTIPGFTSISMYPRMMEASGMGYSELLSRLIDLAIARNREQNL